MIDPRFFELLKSLGRGGSYQHFWTPDGKDGAKLSRWFSTSDPPDLPSGWEKKNVYFSVNPSNLRRSEFQKIHNEDVEAINCLYAEFDCSTPREKQIVLNTVRRWRYAPAAIIDSGGGIHTYVLLDKPCALSDETHRQEAAELQRAWVHFVGGDLAVHDLARVLRVPGTTNFKPNYAPNFPEVKILNFAKNLTHSLDDIRQTLQPILDGWQAKKTHSHAAAGTVSLDDQQLLDVMFAGNNGVKYQNLWNGDLGVCNGDHSACDQMLCNVLAYYTGRDESRVDALFRQSGLFRDKWRDRDDYRQRTLDNAINSTHTVYTGVNGSGPSPAVQAAQSAIGLGSQQKSGAGNAGQIPINTIFLNEGADHEGNAVCVWHLYKDQFRFCDAIGWLHYTGKHWSVQNAEAMLDRVIVDTLIQRRLAAVMGRQEAIVRKTEASSYNVAGTKKLFMSKVTGDIADFDADPELLNCKNGVVNLRTGQLETHIPQQLFTYCVPVEYDPDADYVEWIELLSNLLTSQTMVDFVQLAVGYSATGYTREECLFYVHGPTRSGKGTFTETLLTLLPRPLGVQADFATFTAKREGDTQNFDLAPLRPARFIAASESSKYDTLNEAKIKSATGGDWIRCAYKHRDHFEYRPQFKIWLLSNHPISGDVDDAAFWGRMRTIKFPHSFLGKEDKRLKQRMKSPEVLRGVLAWLVEGSQRWFALPQGLPIPQEVQDEVNKQRNELDYVQQWMDECCTLVPGNWIVARIVYSSYKDWCKENGINEKGIRQFGRALSAKGFNVGIQRRLPNGQRVRGVEGLSII